MSDLFSANSSICLARNRLSASVAARLAARSKAALAASRDRPVMPGGPPREKDRPPPDHPPGGGVEVGQPFRGGGGGRSPEALPRGQASCLPPLSARRRSRPPPGRPRASWALLSPAC